MKSENSQSEMLTMRVLPPLKNSPSSRNPTQYKFNSSSIKEQPNENDEIKIVQRHTGRVEVKQKSSLEGLTMDESALIGLKPVMKKQTIHNSKNVFLTFKSIEI